MKNRQWVLARRPSARLASEDFEYREVEIDGDDLEDGQVLVRNRVFGMAPTMRNWMNEPGRSYRASANIGDPIRGPAAYEVLKSRNPKWPAGSRLLGLSSWQDYVIMEPDPARAPIISIPDSVSNTDAVGVYGLNALTAHVGLLRIGEPKPGETLVVSGAAGSVGAIVSQIGKIQGCRVIGIAGGREKCDWLIAACGVDGVIDYKSEEVGPRLAALCPDGVDVFFDNVGGDILHAVMEHVARKARVIVCGQISAYDSDHVAPGPRDMMRVVYWSVKIQGFLLGDFPDEIEIAQADLMRWVGEGRIRHREDIRTGFASLPATLMDIFRGHNHGTLMLEID